MQNDEEEIYQNMRVHFDMLITYILPHHGLDEQFAQSIISDINQLK